MGWDYLHQYHEGQYLAALLVKITLILIQFCRPSVCKEGSKSLGDQTAFSVRSL